MAMLSFLSQKVSEPSEHLKGVALDWVAHICDATDKFLQWEREHILQGEPSEKTLEEHKQALKWMLRVVRMLHAGVCDPEFPDQTLRANLEAQLWRLDQSWKMLYSPMSDTEADQLLAEIFPDEPRSGSHS